MYRTFRKRRGGTPPSLDWKMAVAEEIPPSYRRLFAIEGLPRLVGSMLLARTAGQMVALVLVLFALERFHSPGLAGLVTFLSIFPGLVLSPIAGALLDRHGRTRLIVLDYLVATAMLALIVVLGATNALSEWALLAIVTVQSLTYPLSQTGIRTLFPLMVPRPLWERANAIDSNGYVVATIFGPALAGALVAGVGSLWAFALTSAMFVIAAVIAIGVRDPLGAVSSAPLLGEAWAGLIYVLRHATLRALALSVGLANIANGFFYIGLPVFVLTRLGGDPAQVGQLFALMGVSAAVSVLFFGRVGTAGRERQLMAGAILGTGIAYLVVAFSPGLAVVVLGMLLIGIATGPFDVVLFTIRQRRTDPAWMGRAFAVSMSLNYIGFPIGSGLAGALVPLSLAVTFAIAVALCVVAAAVTLVAIPDEHRSMV
jgi:MFS family permease